MTDTRHGKKLVLVVVIAFLPVIALGPAKAKPLTQTQVLGLLRGEVAPVRVAQLALEKGIDFTLSPDDEKRLRRAGADAALIKTLRELAAKVVSSQVAGTTKVNSKDGLTYVWIPPGRFIMGCSSGDTECRDDEKPAHEVTMTKGFWLGQTPVTQAAFQHVIPLNLSHFKGDNLPVEGVVWLFARKYCGKIGGRLPTEAEWEYAARAGSTGARYGNLDDIAWYTNNSGGATHGVGQKRPNGFGLYDMLGNVWQWTTGHYAGLGALSDPAGAVSGSDRVLRGGSWSDNPTSVRASCRRVIAPPDQEGPTNMGKVYDNVGFRCVLE
jgi:formylglycine-generating enzyme required for sulfatase activity